MDLLLRLNSGSKRLCHSILLPGKHRNPYHVFRQLEIPGFGGVQVDGNERTATAVYQVVGY